MYHIVLLNINNKLSHSVPHEMLHATTSVRFRIRFVYLAVLLIFAVADDPKSCSSAETWVGKLDEVNVNGCTPIGPCLLERGTEKAISIIFTPNEDLSVVRARVHGVVAGYAVPYAVPQSDACFNSGLECPLNAAQTVTYSASLSVKSFYPLLSLPVKWELVNDQGRVIICTIIPVKIIKGSPHTDNIKLES